MIEQKSRSVVVKRLAGTTAVAAMAAALLATGLPASVVPSWAEPVAVEAPAQAPSFANVVEAVSPAVVSVRVRTSRQEVADNGFQFNMPGFEDLPDDHPMKRFFREFERRGFGGQPESGPRSRARPVSQGSGFFISEDGLLVTNNHVVDNGAEFTVIMDDGTELTATMVGTDPRTDLAVLKVDSDREFTYVEFADDSQIRVGDWVVAVGNPFGLGGTVTAGIISARGRDIGAGPYDDFIQVDAAVNRGNSGGPTFNLSGQVIGINTAIFSPSGGNVGIAFAIPASLASEVISDLIRDGAVSRGWLGVQIQPVTTDIAESLGLDDAAGALVNQPQPGTPAQDAGIEAGDIVRTVNGIKVEDARDLARQIAAIEPGQIAELGIWRRGELETVKVKIGRLSDADQQASLEPEADPTEPASDRVLEDFGMTVVPSEDGRGVLVTDVEQGSEAEQRGISAGDVIVSVNNEAVANADELLSVIDRVAEQGRRAALFQIENESASRFVALPIERG